MAGAGLVLSLPRLPPTDSYTTGKRQPRPHGLQQGRASHRPQMALPSALTARVHSQLFGVNSPEGLPPTPPHFWDPAPPPTSGRGPAGTAARPVSPTLGASAPALAAHLDTPQDLPQVPTWATTQEVPEKVVGWATPVPRPQPPGAPAPAGLTRWGCTLRGRRWWCS